METALYKGCCRSRCQPHITVPMDSIVTTRPFPCFRKILFSENQWPIALDFENVTQSKALNNISLRNMHFAQQRVHGKHTYYTKTKQQKGNFRSIVVSVLIGYD